MSCAIIVLVKTLMYTNCNGSVLASALSLTLSLTIVVLCCVVLCCVVLCNGTHWSCLPGKWESPHISLHSKSASLAFQWVCFRKPV